MVASESMVLLTGLHSVASTSLLLIISLLPTTLHVALFTLFHVLAHNSPHTWICQPQSLSSSLHLAPKFLYFSSATPVHST